MTRILNGHVCNGHNLAVKTFADAAPKIAEKFGIKKIHRGTFNVSLGFEYGIPYDQLLHGWEYGKPNGTLYKLKRCRLGGVRAVIARPLEHEQSGHTRLKCLELVSEYCLRETLRVNTGDLVVIEIEGDDEWWNAPEQFDVNSNRDADPVLEDG